MRHSPIALLLSLILGCTTTPVPAPAPATGVPGPVADHHAHLLSPAGAARNAAEPLAAVQVPADLGRLLDELHATWNDAKGLEKLYTSDAIIHQERNPTWIRGRDEVTEDLSGLFAKQYRLEPVAYGVEGSSAWVAGYFTRPDGASLRRFGHALLSLRRESDGAWRIAAQTLAFPGVETRQTVTAEQLIERHDAAGIQRAAVLSVAYWFGSPRSAPVENEYEKVRAENDWTVAETQRFPERLFPFISFNPLKDYAVQELERFAGNPAVRGIKLHFGNSRVDVMNPEHAAKVRRVFEAANAKKMAILVHLWTDPEYGKAQAEAFLDAILPSAPDIPVSIAHFAGGGPGYTDPALQVYADAITRKDPRTKNLFFDVATVADQQPDEALRQFAARIRQVGPERVLFGTDMGPPHARQSWAIFRTTVPLTDEEFRIIAGNVAPFLR